MKTRKIKIGLIGLAAVVLSMSSCKKLPDEGIYFCSNDKDSSSVHTLFVDGDNKGAIPYFKGSPGTKDKTNLKLVITSRGKHTVKVTDKDNKTVFEADMKVTVNRINLIEKETNTIDAETSLDQGKSIILIFNE